jgi:hypothetical protein
MKTRELAKRELTDLYKKCKSNLKKVEKDLNIPKPEKIDIDIDMKDLVKILKKQDFNNLSFEKKDRIYRNLKGNSKMLYSCLYYFSPLYTFEYISKRSIMYRYKIIYGDLNLNLLTLEKLDNPFELNILKRTLAMYELYNKGEKTLNLMLFLADNRKIFDKPNENYIFTTKMINSACTGEDTIVIFRKEEALKTIIHETMHFFDVDDTGLAIEIPKLSIERYDIKQMKREAYAETMACILNCILTSIQYDKGIKMIYYYIDTEKKFSTLQSAKILYLSKMNINDLFSSDKMIRDETNAVAYHIIKCCYLYNLSTFLLNKHIDFKHIKFIENIKNMGVFLGKNNKRWKSNPYLNTARMTTVE